MISVIIPVRNSENTIFDSLKSVLEQDILSEQLEIICIINGTIDQTVKIIESIDDKRVRIEYSQPGIVPALNTGLRIAKGEFIARQDADDLWHPSKLSKQISFLKSNEDIDIVGTQLRVVDVSQNYLYSTRYPTDHNGIVEDILRGNNPIGHPSVVYRKSILDKCAGYYGLFPMAEDLDLWTRAIAWHKFANIDEELVTYKHTPNLQYDPNIPLVLSNWYQMIYGLIK